MNGGALAARAPVTLNQTSFVGNRTGSLGVGGAVYSIRRANGNAKCVYETTVPAQSGGAIDAVQSLIVNQCDFQGNSVTEL